MQSVSSEEAVSVFDLSTGSSDSGVYAIGNIEGDQHTPGSVSSVDEPVFLGPQVKQLASWFGYLNCKSRLSSDFHTLQLVLTKCRR